MNTAHIPNSILIVEDETLLAWSLANALKRAGFETIVVESGEKAVQLLTKSRFSAVITDVKLPYINGFDVAAAVKSATPLVPVIIISALDDENARRSMMQSHADRFLEKPFDLDELSRVVQSLIAQKSPLTRPKEEAQSSPL
jgi:DNA-binding response OmpR family regulator